MPDRKMSKHERIESFLRSFDSGGAFPACYLAFFSCFNAGDYYQAHDVLEHLWLECRDANAPFFKGLIQVAGAFVHLKKHYERPNHPKDGKRLRPAVRLFKLGISNIRPFGPRHMDLDTDGLCHLCLDMIRRIEASGFSENPWRPDARPFLTPPGTA